MRFSTLIWKKDYLELIDQTKLPHEKVYIKCVDMEDVWAAIREMKVRGAPAIGVTAAFGVYLGVKNSKAKTRGLFLKEFQKVNRRMREARPTARNLFDTIERMEKAVAQSSGQSSSELKRVVLDKALEIQKEDVRLCQEMGKWGAALLKTGDSVLTHCNAGALATAGMGTALSVIYTAVSNGKKIHVYATETRPFLQGARLTSWELSQNGIPVTLLCDNMVGYLMRLGKVNKVIVGADRIASNGDTANKIGTYSAAHLARLHKIPFYVAAPSTTFDFSLRNGSQIPIENRPGQELTKGFARPIAPEGISIFNPAFDVTPHELISGIITEKGVFRPPYLKTLQKLKKSGK